MSEMPHKMATALCIVYIDMEQEKCNREFVGWINTLHNEERQS